MLAFGRSEDWPALSNLLAGRSRQDERAKEVLDAIASIGAKDLPVLVSHGVTIDAFIGEYLQQGEMVVVRPPAAQEPGPKRRLAGCAATRSLEGGGESRCGRLLIP